MGRFPEINAGTRREVQISHAIRSASLVRVDYQVPYITYRILIYARKHSDIVESWKWDSDLSHGRTAKPIRHVDGDEKNLL